MTLVVLVTLSRYCDIICPYCGGLGPYHVIMPLFVLIVVDCDLITLL